MTDYFSMNIAITMPRVWHFIVAFFTISDAVADNKPKFGIVSKRFYVMCMKFATLLSTFLASIIISFKNLFTPVGIFFAFSYARVFRINSSLPIRSLFTFFRFSKATTRTKEASFKAVFFAIIRFTTISANFIFTFSEMFIVINWFKFFSFGSCATFSTTINLFINKIGENIKSFMADWTNLVFTSFISHYCNYNSIEGVNEL